MFLLISYFFQEALSESRSREAEECSLEVREIVFSWYKQCYSHPVSTHQQALSFQTLISLLGSRKIWNLTPLRKHVLQTKSFLFRGQRHHICVRLSSEYYWCSPYICWCFDTGEVGKSFTSITEPAKIQKYMGSDQNHLQDQL